MLKATVGFSCIPKHKADGGEKMREEEEWEEEEWEEEEWEEEEW
ncbi:MAG: hypothetical protein QHH18_00530 [Candidatus Bathyarchaeota archaeon]|jgi:ribosomal protein L12E/L44/L45/RPP1/RPP2|nr:hypothetical protein [Candidatus Bathyarchaeota archaeon]